jgi:NhaP-type Na+/H+ or K+/H+ antiporter
MIALIVILLRAGFELSKDSLDKVGRQAVLLAFLPALAADLAAGLVVGGAVLAAMKLAGKA